MSTKVRNSVYELKRKNPITLGDDSNIEANLKPIKIDSKNSILELSENELKVRGAIDASAITVDGASVQTGTEENTITALNNATANELVTVGATTTELDSESKLTFDGSNLAIAATGKIYLDGGTASYIHMPSADIMEFIVFGQSMFTMQNSVSDFVIAANAHYAIHEGKHFYLDGAAGGEYLKSVDNDVLIYAGGNQVLELTSEGTYEFKNDYSFDVSADNVLDILDSESSVFKIETASISIPAENKLYFDTSAGHTYIQQSVDDVLDIYVGGDKALSISEAGSYVSMLSGWTLYFDNGTHTYIKEASDDVLDVLVEVIK